jgi:beta-N-acetylhexosaminidase
MFKFEIGNMNTELNKLVNQSIKNQVFPGAVIAVGNGNGSLFNKAYGYHTYKKINETLVSDIFDLASLTKVIATASSIMILFDRGLIELDEYYYRYLSKYKIVDPLKKRITVRNLLAHCSGYPSSNRDIRHHKFQTAEERWNELLLNTPLVYKTESKTVYSDVNYQILGKIVESVSGKSLDEFASDNIFHQLDMKETLFNPGVKYYERVVPTEYNSEEGALVKGYVHDPNARLLNAIAGHAGVFSTADNLSKFCSMILNKGNYINNQIIKSPTINLFAKRDLTVVNSSRALGWDTAYRADLQSKCMSYSAGDGIDAAATGHTGFTGTSVWISSKHNLYVVILTNRVCPSRDHTDIEIYKKHIHDIASCIWKHYTA